MIKSGARRTGAPKKQPASSRFLCCVARRGPPSPLTKKRSALCRMRCEMREQQRRDLVRNLLGSKMPNAWQDFELIWRTDKFCRALCCHAADRIVGIAPNEQGRHLYDTERCADRAARTIPGERCLHCGRVTEHRNMQRDRCRRYVVRLQTLAQPSHIVGKNPLGSIRFEKPPMMRRATLLLSVGRCQGAVKRIGMRTREHSQRGEARRVAVRDTP